MDKRGSSDQGQGGRIGELDRRRWTERDGRRALAAWRRSGLSVSEFARRHGLNPQRLSWWSKQLGQWSEGETIKKRRVAVATWVPAEVCVNTASSAAPMMVLRLPGGVAIEFAEPNAVPPGWIASVLSELWRQS
jgi:transposase-like protein